jgi:hypothetical protein
MRRCLALIVVLTLAACVDVREPLAPEAARVATATVDDALTARLDAAGAHIVPDRFIVTVAPGVDPVAVLNEYDLAARHVYRSALNGFAATVSPSLLHLLRADSRVVRIEPETHSRVAPPGSREGTPVRSLSPSLQAAGTRTTLAGGWDAPAANWGLDRISQRHLPLNGRYRYNSTGRGVNVYVIGSGIRFSHREFEGRARLGVDVVGDGRNGEDCYGLGTHSASIIAGATFGVAKEARLIAVRVTRDCTPLAFTSDVLAGIEWVTTNHSRPAVAHLYSERVGASVADAVRASIAAGVSYALPAGNTSEIDDTFGTDACNLSLPRLSEAMTVSAADESDARFARANWGECVDLYAPDGDHVTGAAIRNNNATGASPDWQWNMTTTAAAFAAGVAALYLQDNPGAPPAEVLAAIRATVTRDVITRVGPPGPPVQRHMLYSLLTPEGNQPPPPLPVAPSGLTAAAVSASRIRLVWEHGGEAVEAFELQRAEEGVAFRTIAWLEADLRTWDNSALTWSPRPDTEYTYRIRAANSAGSSGWSNEASARTHARPPTPTGLQATALSNEEVRLTWSWDGEDGVGFEILREVHGRFGVMLQIGPDYHSYVDRRVEPDSTYRYRVRAVAQGTVSEASETVEVTVPASPAPSPPETVVLVVADTAWLGDDVMVTLRWRDARGARAELIVNGAWQYAVNNTGEHTVYVRRPGGADYTFRICEQHFPNCSNPVTRTLSKPTKKGGGRPPGSGGS